MINAKEKVDRVLGWFLVLLMGVSVLNVLWQVFTRFVLQSPSTFTTELARFLLIWVGILGAGYAVGQRMHLALDLLPRKLSGRKEVWLNLVIQVFVLLFAVFVMVIGGARLMYIQLKLGQTSAALGLPLGYVYSVLPLSGLIIAYYAIVHIQRQRKRLKGKVIVPDEEKYVGADKDLYID